MGLRRIGDIGRFPEGECFLGEGKPRYGGSQNIAAGKSILQIAARNSTSEGVRFSSSLSINVSSSSFRNLKTFHSSFRDVPLTDIVRPNGSVL